MNYKEARVYLDSVTKYGSVLGLENMRELLGRLGNPQNGLRFLHISGTNGKGSVLAYLSTVLKEAGYRVGRYISPTLFSYRERIQVDGEYIKREALARHVSTVQRVIEEMQAQGLAHPTLFEIETVISFLCFLEEKCDIVVLETGMGGAQDATNIIETTVLEVITPISMDHMQLLGNTLAEIAEQKAGIIKKNTAVVTARQKPEAMAVIEKKAKEQHCTLLIADGKEARDVCYGLERQSFSYGGYDNLEISMAGSYQITNAVLAVEAVKALKALGYHISRESLYAGMRKTQWRGRFTVIGRDPCFIIDGAHNRDGALALRDSIERYFAGRRLFYLCGVFKDKEYEEILKITAPYSDWMAAIQTPDNPRALPAQELAKTAGKYIRHVQAEQSIEDGVKAALQAADRKDDVILAFGSLSFLGELTRIVEELKERK